MINLICQQILIFNLTTILLSLTYLDKGIILNDIKFSFYNKSILLNEYKFFLQYFV